MKKVILLFTLLFAVCLSASAKKAKADKSFTITGDTPWFFTPEDYANVAVKMAFRDIQRDWYKVFGYPPVIFKGRIPRDWDGPVIVFGQEQNIGRVVYAKVPKGKEQYKISVVKTATNPVMYAAGSDTRGTIYAMYTFAEKVLGIDPMYVFTDSKPVKQSSIVLKSNFEIESTTPTFENRGWFINDEELHDGLHRDPLGGNVISMEWMDKILETLLRTKCNMIIPETAPYPDATVYELCKRRGVIVTHHHVTPLGVNMMNWPENVPFSFLNHKDILIDAWQKAIKVQEGQEIVWVIGFRGKADEAFWRSDPLVPDSDEGRAKIISEVMQTQVELIRKHDPDATIVAALWNEQAAFYNAGLLTIPEGVCKMFSDDGRGFMRDNGGENVSKGDGLYYHVMMMMKTQNRSTECVPPSRFYSELKRYVDKGATKYAVVNVSGIRPAVMSVQAISDFMWDAKTPLSKDAREATVDYLNQWHAKQFSPELAESLTDLRMKYYDIPYMRDQMPVQGRWKGARGEHLLHTLIQEWMDSTYVDVIAEGGDITKVQGYASRVKSANEPTAGTAEFFPGLCADVNKLYERIPSERKDFYQMYFMFQVAIHKYSSTALSIVNDAVDKYAQNKDKMAFAEQMQSALDQVEAIVEAAHKAEYGAWDTMYMHIRMLDFWKTRLMLKAAIAKIKGEPYTSLYRGYYDGNLWTGVHQYMKFGDGVFPYFHKHSGRGLEVIENGTY